MNATEWLHEATHDLPREIADRLRAETLDHIAEAGARNVADVTPSSVTPGRSTASCAACT